MLKIEIEFLKSTNAVLLCDASLQAEPIQLEQVLNLCLCFDFWKNEHRTL